MKRIAAGTPDSHTTFGGEMPDAGGVSGGKVPAFRLIAPAPSSIPVLIAVPHAGRAYTPALLGALRNPALAAARLEDRLAEAHPRLRGSRALWRHGSRVRALRSVRGSI